MNSNTALEELVARLVEYAYPELKNCSITARFGRTQAFASVTWDSSLSEISIRCNRITKNWHDAPLTGLLAHELSHPVQTQSGRPEMHTDLDAIERGLAPYLAIERLYAEKYEDHLLHRGKDKYLGYRTVRQKMTNLEVAHLDAMLEELSLIPPR